MASWPGKEYGYPPPRRSAGEEMSEALANGLDRLERMLERELRGIHKRLDEIERRQGPPKP